MKRRENSVRFQRKRGTERKRMTVTKTLKEEFVRIEKKIERRTEWLRERERERERENEN